MGWDKGYFSMHHLNVPRISSDSLQGYNLPESRALVGGFKHVLFSILYGIILPID